MEWFSTAGRTPTRHGARSARHSRPSIEAVEGRQLLSSMVTNFNGVSGLAGGAVWHYQDNGGWSSVGGGGIASMTDSKNQYGGDEMFARLGNGSVWSYDYSSGQWKGTGGFADSMIASSNGIDAILGGAVWHYQDNGGWVEYGGIGVTSVVDSHNKKGQEELFVRLNTHAVWSYTPVTGQWKSTGGNVDSMVGARDGVNTLAGGSIWHYQDDGGWSGVGGIAIASIVDSRDPYGRDEVFARLGNNAVWSYTFATGQWKDTGGSVDTMIANADGISGTTFGTLGYLWHYQDDGGWVDTGGGQVASLVDSYDQFGQEEMFARLNDHTIWYYSFATKTWNSAKGALD